MNSIKKFNQDKIDKILEKRDKIDRKEKNINVK